jgi:hypothetical protein
MDLWGSVCWAATTARHPLDSFRLRLSAKHLPLGTPQLVEPSTDQHKPYHEHEGIRKNHEKGDSCRLRHDLSEIVNQ